MNILITNDDGYNAVGIMKLAAALSKNNNIFIIAPNKNRSGVSHCISMNNPLEIVKIKDNEFTCSGTPVDCVISGLKGIFNNKIDVVISGINKGANLGTDIVYSGTASAARQASFYGIPAIAVSLETFDGSWIFEPLADFIQKNLEILISLCDKDVFVNINAKSTSEYKGFKFTNPANRNYQDDVSIYNGPNSRLYSFFIGGEVLSSGDENNDANVVYDGFISISRIMSQPVSLEIPSNIQEQLCLEI